MLGRCAKAVKTYSGKYMMDNNLSQLPQWCWYNSQFLFLFDEYLKINPNISILDFMKIFEKQHGLEPLHPFVLKNQGAVIMSMYGLLVLPKEIWKDKINDFGFESKKQIGPFAPLGGCPLYLVGPPGLGERAFQRYSGLRIRA